MAVIINQEMGADILIAAQDTAADYNERGVTYRMGGDASQGGSTSDCSHFVHDAIRQVRLSFFANFERKPLRPPMASCIPRRCANLP